MRFFITLSLSFLVAACTSIVPPHVDPSQSGSIVNTDANESSSVDAQTVLQRIDGAPVTESGAWHFLETGVMEYGEPEEPNVLTVFLEYHCPYCKEFTEDYLPKLAEEIPELQVRMVPYPLVKYPNSRDAVAAMICAGAQGRGGGMHKMLFANEDKSRKQLLKFATDLGLNATSFEQCIDSDGIQAFLQSYRQLADELHVTVVPTFFMNNERRVGLPVYPELRGWITSQL